MIDVLRVEVCIIDVPWEPGALTEINERDGDCVIVGYRWTLATLEERRSALRVLADVPLAGSVAAPCLS